MSFIVAITGGRDFGHSRPDFEHLKQVLDALHHTRSITTLVHGGARGADSLADWWARDKEIEVRVFPAEWDRHGKAAGPIRNREMLKEHVDLLVAFPGGRGTANAVACARNRNIAVLDHRGDKD